VSLELGPLFERVRDAVLVAERDSGKVVRSNPAAESLFGDARGKTIAELLPGGEGEGKAAGRGGKEIFVEAQLFDLDDGHRLAIVRDVTAQRTLERERGSFVAAVSHDLKSPLAAISGQAQLLQRKIEQLNLPDGATMARRLARIDETTYRMSRLIDDLLDVARLQMGRPLELNRQPVDLVALARQAVQQLQPTTTRHRLELSAAEPTLAGFWDPARIARVADNLLLNAIKYSPDGGDIAVGIARDGPWAVMAVRDPGMGIPAADLPRIFERFHRGANVARKITGSGIGLAGSKQIVEQHGGSIEVESREGGGSTFTVRLPLEAGGAP
jgi:signal transduction histidine kinase